MLSMNNQGITNEKENRGTMAASLLNGGVRFFIFIDNYFLKRG